MRQIISGHVKQSMEKLSVSPNLGESTEPCQCHLIFLIKFLFYDVSFLCTNFFFRHDFFSAQLFFRHDQGRAPLTNIIVVAWSTWSSPGGGEGGTPIYGLYRYLPRNRVQFLRLNRVSFLTLLFLYHGYDCILLNQA